MSPVMPAMYLQQSNEKVFVKTYTTDWLADKGNSKINIIESLSYSFVGEAGLVMVEPPAIWCLVKHRDSRYFAEIALLYTLHYTICTGDNAWDTGGLSCFPTASQVSYLTLNLLMECDFADVDSDTSKTDETLAVFDLTTS